MEYNKAIVIMSFGSTHLDALDKTIKILQLELSKKFCEYFVTVAYTSNFIKNRLLGMNVNALSPSECLQSLVDKSYGEVIVLPTHIVNGIEYSKVVDCIKKFDSKFKSIKLCSPLLNLQDVSSIVDTILTVFRVSHSDFLILVGHGNDTSLNEMYSLVNLEFSTRGIKNLYMSTIMGNSGLDYTLQKVKEYNPKRVTLVPFLFVSGSHAIRDISIKWKSFFEYLGFDTKCLLKGLGEYPEFRSVYIKKVQQLL